MYSGNLPITIGDIKPWGLRIESLYFYEVVVNIENNEIQCKTQFM